MKCVALTRGLEPCGKQATRMVTVKATRERLLLCDEHSRAYDNEEWINYPPQPGRVQ